jgi:hypothetical protein
MTLDEKGRCCGRKPIVYKRPKLHYFCDRCCSEYSAEKRKVHNFAWELRGGNWIPRAYCRDAERRGVHAD